MKTLIAFATAALLCTASPAQAQEPGDIPTVRVSYGDLDLSRAGGRDALEQRIRHAIERVCPARPAPAELGRYRLYRACKAATWEGVKPQLAQIYGGRQLADSAVRIVATGK